MQHRTLCLIVELTFVSFLVGCSGSPSEKPNNASNEETAPQQETASLTNQSGESRTAASPSTSPESSTPYVDPSDDPVIQARRRRYLQSSSEFKSNATDGEAAGEKPPKAATGSELKPQDNSDPRAAGSKLEFLKSFAPEAIGEMTLDEFLRRHPDASRNNIRSNSDGSSEITWGDNLVSHNAMFLKGKLLAYRWKVVRFSKSDAENEAKQPFEFLGKPDSNAVPNNQPNMVSWNDWIVSNFLVSTGVSVAIDKDGSPAYFAERHVVNQTLLDQGLKGSASSTSNQSALVGTKPSLALSSNTKPVEEITNGIGMKMVLIPAGSFTMGSPESEEGRREEERQHKVRITKAFYIGIFEVTQEQYRQIVNDNPSYYSPMGRGASEIQNQNTDRFPVEQVSWLDAVRFCNQLSTKEKLEEFYRIEDNTVIVLGGYGYRLPTEAEWEYACRAGTQTAFSFGGSLPSKENVEDVLNRTTTVGASKANGFGLYDMHGNVMEWCGDVYDEHWYTISPQDDPSGPKIGSSRVIRGGNYYTRAYACRSARRGVSSPSGSSSTIGFRCVLTWH